MANKFLKHRWHKVLLAIVLLLIVLVGLGALLINKIAEPIVAKKLRTALAKGTDSLYRSEFKLELSILQGKAVLHDLKLRPDTNIFKTLKKAGKAPDKLYELHVKRFEVSGMRFLKMYLNKELVIGRINIDEPQLKAGQYINKDKKLKEKDDRPLYDKIKESLRLIRIDKITLNNGSYKITNYTHAKPTTSVLNKLNVIATNLLIDSTTKADTTRMLFCKDITTAVSNYFGRSANGLYTYKLKSLKLSTQRSELHIAGVDIIPVAFPAFFAKNKGDRFILHLDSIILNNFDYKNYRDHQNVQASKIALKKGYFEVMGNYNGAITSTDRIVTFPHWALQNAAKIDINIDTLLIKKMEVVYKQRGTTSLQTGTIRFANTNAKILNITNRKDLIKKNNNCSAVITSYYMGIGKFDISFNFKLGDHAYPYSYKGHLAPMNIAVANPATVPLAMVKITSGRVKTLDFTVNGNRTTSTGKLNFLYNDLKVDVLRKDDKKGYTKKSLLSFLANSLIVKENNPDKPGDKPRTATIIFKRPWNFPFFQTIWLSVLSGIKPIASIGDTKEDVKLKKHLTEKELKKKQEELKKAKEQKKKEEKIQQEKLKGKKKD
jgi:hypothetical protein